MSFTQKMLSYQKKPFKSLTFYWKKTSAGRNSSGHITAFHRGGGLRKKQRRIDFQRFITNKGQVIRVEYDPCRTAWIALIQWFVEPCARETRLTRLNGSFSKNMPATTFCSEKDDVIARRTYVAPCFSYVPAWDSFKIGEIVNNAASVALSTPKNKLLNKSCKKLEFCGPSSFAQVASPKWLRPSGDVLNTMFFSNNINSKYYNQTVMNAWLDEVPSTRRTPSFTNNLIYKNGNSLFLCNIPIGTQVHNIELAPQKGAQLCRAAGTFAELVEKMENKCLIRLPSGKEQYLDFQCRATIGASSNLEHKFKMFYKAGQNRWRGKRPTVRGVAMNPIDHPHGGGEGRTKGGRPSVSPWGKPCKSGFKTVLRKKRY